MNASQKTSDTQTAAAKKREEIFMGFMAFATVFGAAGVGAIPLHEPTAYVLGGLSGTCMAGGLVMGAVGMGIESVRHIKSSLINRRSDHSRG